MDNLILKITGNQKYGVSILLQDYPDLAILIIATGKTGTMALLHDHYWFGNGEDESPNQHVALSGTWGTSNIFTFHLDKAFATSKNIHVPKWNFLFKNVSKSDSITVPFTKGDANIASVSCGVLLPL